MLKGFKMARSLMLKNVRLSFPSLFKKAEFNGVVGKYEATMLLPKTDTEQYEKVIEAIEACKKDTKLKVANNKFEGFSLCSERIKSRAVKAIPKKYKHHMKGFLRRLRRK